MILILEKLVLLKVLDKMPRILKHVYTLVIVMLGWALFYFEDMTALGVFFVRLFTVAPTSQAAWNLISAYLPLTAAAVIACTPWVKTAAARHGEKAFIRYGRIAVAAAGLLLCVAALAKQSYNPFIYFRF